MPGCQSLPAAYSHFIVSSHNSAPYIIAWGAVINFICPSPDPMTKAAVPGAFEQGNISMRPDSADLHKFTGAAL